MSRLRLLPISAVDIRTSAVGSTTEASSFGKSAPTLTGETVHFVIGFIAIVDESNHFIIIMVNSESIKPLARTVTCHAWNGDATQVALCPNNNQVWIFSVTDASDGTTSWTKTHVLEEHDSLVAGIDWSPVTNLIVTCGHDRNSYVWKLVDGVWQPTLVILRINRAANSVRWSASGMFCREII